MYKIYFIQCGINGPIKIGYSKNIKHRLSNLQHSNPIRLTLLTTINGDKIKELELHNKFKKFHIIGEWFQPSDEILEFISGCQSLNLCAKHGLMINNIQINKIEKIDQDKSCSIINDEFENYNLCQKCGKKPGVEKHTTDTYVLSVCHRCCMELDGRLERFRAQAIGSGERRKKPPIQCLVCKQIKKHQSHGRCNSCAEYFRRNGVDKIIKSIEDFICKNCEKCVNNLSVRGNCPACEMYIKRHGIDRPEFIYSNDNKFCISCEKSCKSLKKDQKCNNCSEFKRIYVSRGTTYRQCKICYKLTNLLRKQKCISCYRFYNKYGQDKNQT